MLNELATVDHYDEMNRVVESMLKGTKVRQIAKDLGLRVVDVEKYVTEWQNIARNNRHIQDRAREALSATDQHYDLIISELWDVVEYATLNDDMKVKASTLKMIADIEQKRIDMLQKSGLLDNQHLAEQVLAMEKEHEAIKRMFRELAIKFPETAPYMREQLSKISNQVEGTVISVEPL